GSGARATTPAPSQPGDPSVNIVLLPGSESSLKLRASTRRIGLCWEATRAPRWTRIPQAWAAQVAQAGLLRDRRQSEKSQGFGDRVPESFPDQTKTRTRGKSAVAFSANRRFTLNQYKCADRSLMGLIKRPYVINTRVERRELIVAVRIGGSLSYGRQIDQCRHRR